MKKLFILASQRTLSALLASALLATAGPACTEADPVKDPAALAEQEMILAAELPTKAMMFSASAIQSCVDDMGEECFSTVTSLRCGQEGGMQKFSATCDAAFSDDG